jgi:nicotinate phosphoribosyltransferase
VLCLIDTYEVSASGIRNFLCVGLALQEVGYKPLGIRLDSGDLAYWSKFVRQQYQLIDTIFGFPLRDGSPTEAFNFEECLIVASNDINEDVLWSLHHEGHEIDVFGIGTHLVTCQKQPALGCVFKLVEINDQPRIKLSQEMEKLVIPGRKTIYRLFAADGVPLVDLMQTCHEPTPAVGKKLLVTHPFAENKRAYVTPHRVEELISLVFDGQQLAHNGIVQPLPSLDERRQRCFEQIESFRHDHIRPVNPCPYKISVSQNLYDYLHNLWMSELPIKELA